MKKGQRNERKKQERALKKRTEKKQKLARRKAQETAITSTKGMIHRARRYPIEGCWVQRGWQDKGIAAVAVARIQPDENLVFGMYLVDYYCLGVKDSMHDANVPGGVFHNEFLPRVYQAEPPISIKPELAHEIVYGAVEYAEQFDLHPHSSFRLSQYVLDPPDAHPRSGNVEFGKDGKPLYVAGPRDNPYAVIRTLERTAGSGNYNFLSPSTLSDDAFLEEESDEDEPASALWVPTYEEEEDKEESALSTLWIPGMHDAPKKDDEADKSKPRSDLWLPGR
jgi:hypothetical protein